MNFSLPRTFTRGIRFKIDVENCNPSDAAVQVELDDLAFIEWQTPWYASGALILNADRVQATHLQYLSDE